MNDAAAAVQRYLATWNESDPARRSDLVHATWTETARYADPLTSAEGARAIDAMIGAVQTRFPAHRFEPHGAADGHGTNLRFAWQLHDPDGAPVAGGTDFAVLAADGRFAAVTGFLDRLPSPASPA